MSYHSNPGTHPRVGHHTTGCYIRVPLTKRDQRRALRSKYRGGSQPPLCLGCNRWSWEL